MKILSWNVKGMNSPQKRKIIFLSLERNKTDIICLQESHIKSKDVRLIKNPKVGKEYVSSIDKSKRGVILYVKDYIELKQIFSDRNGYYVGVEILKNGRKILVIGIYSPVENKGSYYAKLQKKILEYDFENIIMVGDFNGVIEPKIDRKSDQK